MESKLMDVLLEGNPLAVFLFVIVSLLTTVFRGEIIQFLGKLKDAIYFTLFQKDIRNKILSLKQHDLFTVIEDTRRKVKHQKFYTNGKYDYVKTMMFIDFMNNKLDSIRDGFQTLIDDAITIKGNTRLKNTVIECVQEITKEYCEKTLDLFIMSGVPIEEAETAVATFEKWRMATIEVISSRIMGVFSSNYSNTKYENLTSVMELISVATALIPSDGVMAFESMNGNFSQITYRKNKNK